MTGALEALRYEAADGVGLIRLARPEKLNALNARMVAELRDVLERVRADASIRALVVTGTGRAFSAGADIAELAALSGTEDFLRFIEAIQTTFEVLEDLPLPTVAALNGLAHGGGLELALACDLRVGAGDATLALPEIKLGVLPGAGGTQRVPRLLPTAVAKELLFLGEPLGSEAALRLGLVNAVVPREHVLDEALALGRRLAALPSLALRAAKRLARIAVEADPRTGFEAERLTVASLFGTADRREGMGAFLARRAPVFSGR